MRATFFCCLSSLSLVTSVSLMGQTLTTSKFYFFGRRHCTASGYQKHVRDYTYSVQLETGALPLGHKDADGVDLTGQTVVVTGANSGIGQEVARYAASKGAEVYMLCRSEKRAEAAKQDIVKSIQSHDSSFQPSIHVLLADLAELGQVRKAVESLKGRLKSQQVNTLVCNAGVLLNERQLTSEGNEITFGCHLLGGSYLLSQLVKPARCVMITSGGMYNYKLPSWPVLTSTDPDTAYDGQNIYAFCKRAQVLLAQRWAQTLPNTEWVTAHPGWVDTPAVDEAYGKAKVLLQPLRTPWQGAEGICWLLSPDHKVKNGSMYLDRREQPLHLGSGTETSDAEVDELLNRLAEAANL